jgi:hypothetical protein
VKFTKEKVDTADELLARVSDVAGRITEREGRLRRTTRDPRTRFAKRVESYGGIV